MESPFRDADLKDLSLIETLGWDGQSFARLGHHLARLDRGLRALGWSPIDAAAALHQAVRRGEPARVRLTCGAGGLGPVTLGPLVPLRAPWRVRLSATRLWSADPWLRIKSTRRELYDQTRAALPEAVDEMIFANERDEVCEGTITNLFFDLGEGLRTPPLTCGLLPGCLRAEMLAQGHVTEAVLPLADLPKARIWLGNSLRGLIRAEIVAA